MRSNKAGFPVKVLAVCAVWLLPLFSQEPAAAGQARQELLVFYSPTCHRCKHIEETLLPKIAAEFQDTLTITRHSTADMEQYKLFLSLQEKHRQQIDAIMPVFYCNGRFLSGKGVEDYASIKAFITEALQSPGEAAEGLPSVDLVERFGLFRPLAVISFGLVDGINPCAFTVMIFFMSFLVVQGYRRFELAAVGIAFIFAVFLAYVLIGIGLFGFLYRLEGFWLVSRIVNAAIGMASIFLGVLALSDFLRFRKNPDTEGQVLQLPPAIKNRIHAIIGLHYRGGQQQKKRRLLGLLLSALVTGFLVSLLEAVCTGQMYVPTLVFIFKTTHLKVQALAYILLYNLMFVVPLFIIFFFALLGVTSAEFAGFLKKRLAMIKILMAAVFFSLGIALLYAQAPHGAREEASTPIPAAGTEAQDSFSWDFGQVQEGAVVKHEFLFKNESVKTLSIERVDTSCGCTVPEVKKRMLLPNESTVITVEFRSKGYSGPTQQFVYIHTNSLDNPVFRFIIRADVIALDTGPGSKK